MKISVCMATYNGALYVREQVLSILPQLNSFDELIVSDDGSSDDTLKVLNDINDPRIIIVRSKGFNTPILNFENALKHSSGDIIFLSDQDDIWMTNKVDVIINALKYSDLIFSDALIINEEGEIIRKNFFNSIPSKDVLKNIFFNHFFGATMAFKRDVLCKALPFPSYIPMHDQWLGLIAARYFKVSYINEPLIKYRRHGANASFCGEKSNNTLGKKIMFRLNIIKALLSRQVL